MKINYTLTILFCCLTASLNAQIISRLTAQANTGYDTTNGTGYIPVDSSVYTYGYSRSSDMKTGLYLFDTSIRHQNTGSGLVLSERYLRTYEDPAAVRVQSEIKQVYTNGAWQNNQQTTYHYPASFGTTNSTKKDTILVESWNNPSNAWYKLSRTSITYNTNKDVTEELIQKFNNLSQTWDNERMITNTYTSNKLTSRIEKQWDMTGSTWRNVLQVAYSYSGNNLMTETTQGWDQSTTSWTPIMKIEYAYNTSGENISKTYSRWLPPTSTWDFTTKDQYEYTSGSMTSDTFSSWNGTSWERNWLYTYTYDNAKNLLMALTRTPGPDSFLYYRMQEWTYNTYNQPTKFMASEWNFVTKMWDPMNGSATLSNYYYTLFNVGVKPLSPAISVNVFPVPAQNFFVLSLELDRQSQLKGALYDMQGRMVKYWSETAAKSYRRTVPVSELPNGIYILHINTGNKELTQTLSIQR